MSELIIRSNGTYIEDPSGELIPVKVHYTRVDAPPSLDTDHAVAAEREAIAVWLEGYLVKPMIANDGHYSVTYDRDALVHAIRNGAHHTSTPPNAQEQG